MKGWNVMSCSMTQKKKEKEEKKRKENIFFFFQAEDGIRDKGM